MWWGCGICTALLPDGPSPRPSRGWVWRLTGSSSTEGAAHCVGPCFAYRACFVCRTVFCVSRFRVLRVVGVYLSAV